VDDLQSVVDENLNSRKIEAEKAKTIVNYESSEFQMAQQSYTVIPLIRGLRERAEEIRTKEVEKFLSQNSALDSEIVENFIACSKTLMAKLIHDQIINLKKQGSADKNELKLIAEVLGIASQKISEIPLRAMEKKQRESV
jgi:glutamyl-tRNA reductase